MANPIITPLNGNDPYSIRTITPIGSDHTNCIPRSELPRLPDGVVPPFKSVCTHMLQWIVCDSNGNFIKCQNQERACWLESLLNTVYPEGQASSGVMLAREALKQVPR